MDATYRKLLLLFIVLFIIVHISAQQGENTTKLPIQMSILPSATLSLASTEDTTASKRNITQQIVTPKSNNETWINYSTVVQEGSSYTICASLSFSDTPGDIVVKMKVSSDAGAGQGKVGIPTETITLSDYPQAIIGKIGTCYTGQGINKGHLVQYIWNIISDDYETQKLSQDIKDYKIGVIFTFLTGE